MTNDTHGRGTFVCEWRKLKIRDDISHRRTIDLRAHALAELQPHACNARDSPDPVSGCPVTEVRVRSDLRAATRITQKQKSMP
jgi:hypothetical protein